LTPRAQLEGFLAKFDPKVARQAKAALKKMRVRLPGAIELVYDNYNALAIGFGPTERASEAVFSIAVYPRWVSLFFLRGIGLRDPKKVLKGSGNQVRHIVLQSTEELDKSEIQSLMDQALERADPAIDASKPRKLIIKSISAKQRPRR
jgi:Domain of unknown function (DU1801)